MLLIGDSITRGYRPFVNEMLRSNAYVDMLATSKAVDNPAFLWELDYMVNHRTDFKYSAIHINNGLHGWHLSVEDYEIYYNKMIRHLIQHTQHVPIVIANSTPATIKGDTSTDDEKVNTMVIERNEVIKRLAKNYHLQINDLYTPMYGKSEYRDPDGLHYNAEGQEAQAVIVVKIIESILNRNPVIFNGE